MAQSGFSPILIYGSTTTGNTPSASNLTTTSLGVELAINATDGKLFYKDNSGNVQVLATKATGTIGGSNTQVQYNSSGSLAGSANMTFNGTTLTLANDASISGLTVGKGNGTDVLSTAVGSNALSTAYTGNSNTAIGRYALSSLTSGTNNNALGRGALINLTTGGFNVGVGDFSLQANTTASNNTAVGYQSLYSNTTGTPNTAVGYQAGYSNTTGDVCAVGSLALQANTTGIQNTAFGRSALQSNTTGNQGAAFGQLSLVNNTTGGANASFGNFALQSNTTGSNNTALGNQALNQNTTASNNTAVGYQAGYSANTASNVFIGYVAGYAATTGGNTIVGAYAGQTPTGGNNTLVGFGSGNALTTGSQNTFVGSGVLGAVYGAGSAVTTGTKNTILGSYSGNQGGLDIRTASNYIVLSDGDGNPRAYCDNNGTWYAGTSSQNSARLSLGASTGASLSCAQTNSTGDQIYFRTSSSTLAGYITCATSTTTSYLSISDHRLKTNVQPMTNALDKVAQLKPCTYTWLSDNSTGQGFIAHELQEVVPDCVVGEKDAVDSEGKPIYQGVDTSFLVATLTAAIQELSAEVTALKAKLGA